MDKRLVWVIVIGAVLIAFVTMCMVCSVIISKSAPDKPAREFTPKEEEPSVEVEAPEEPEEPLTVENVEWGKGGSKGYIVGTVVNNSDETYNVSVEIPLYDKDDARIGTASDFISDLRPGQRWNFKCYVFERGLVSFSSHEVELSYY